MWRSTDGGATWIKRHPLDTGPITVSFDDPATLWAGNWDSFYRPLARSTDGGLIWGTASQGIAVQSSPITPILIDPQAHNVMYALAYGDARPGGPLPQLRRHLGDHSPRRSTTCRSAMPAPA